MPQLTGSLQPEGALVDIKIGWSGFDVQALRQQLRPIPQSVHLRALIDTGAEVTCLDPVVVKSLMLPLEKPTLVNMPGGIGFGISTLHRAGATVPHPSGNSQDDFVIPNLVVCELPLSALGYDAIIGRDILDSLRFLYDGPARTYSFDY